MHNSGTATAAQNGRRYFCVATRVVHRAGLLGAAVLSRATPSCQLKGKVKAAPLTFRGRGMGHDGPLLRLQ